MAVGWQKAEARARKADAEMQPEIADVVTRAGREASAGQLTLDRARKHLMEIYRLATDEEFPSYSVEKWLQSWLKTNSKRVGDATMRRYQTSVTDILSALGTARKRDIALLTTEDVAKVQAKLSKSGTKASTTNFKVQDFKNAIRAAFEQGIIDRNVGAAVRALHTSDSELRTEFTRDEIKKLITTASHDWKGAILVAALTGLRLSNIAELKWSEVDMNNRELVLVPVKQRKGKEEVISIPLATPLETFLKNRFESAGKSSGPVFPKLSGRQPATLSTTFNNLIKKTGIPKEVDLPGGKKGTRSFHSLRHFYVSSLANAAIPEDVRKTLAAHKSGEVHRIYTHHDKATLRNAIDSLPELNEET